MAKLTKLNRKVFGINATKGVFGSKQAGNPVTSKTDYELLQSLTAYENGFNDSTIGSEKLLPQEDLDSAVSIASYEIAYLLQEGVSEWSNLDTYYKGGIVKVITGTDVALYSSLIDDNKNKAPASNTTSWQCILNSATGFVDLTSVQTITGVKNFAQGSDTALVKVQNTTAALGTAPTSEKTAQVRLDDVNGEWIGLLQSKIDTSNKNTTEIIVRKGDKSGSAAIGVSVDSSGNVSTYAPTPAASSSDTNIANTTWCRTNLVDKTSTQSITGQKTFSTAVYVPTADSNANNTQAANTTWVNTRINTEANPTGTIIIWSTSTAPSGYLICDGSAISRTTYANLFAVIGTTYGSGDGNTTFNLPNYSQRAEVVESYQSGSYWYRLYSDGWLEQGGVSPAGQYRVTFLKQFADTNYTATASFNDGYSANSITVNDRSVTGLILNRGTSLTDIGNKAWLAFGKGTIPAQQNKWLIKY